MVAAVNCDFLDGVQVLLDAGVSIDYISARGTTLYAAVKSHNEEIAKLLLESGADPNTEGWQTRELLRVIRDG